jgi:hypothetical protein
MTEEQRARLEAATAQYWPLIAGDLEDHTDFQGLTWRGNTPVLNVLEVSEEDDDKVQRRRDWLSRRFSLFRELVLNEHNPEHNEDGT